MRCGIKLGLTRQELVAILGKPDGVGCSTRKYPTPSLYVYGKMEFHFCGWKNGGLFLVYYEANEPTKYAGVTLLLY